MTPSPYRLPLMDARQQLAASASPFVQVFAHGTMRVELYAPAGRDLQSPHAQDELYVVIAGRGGYRCNDTLTDFGPGDVLFAPAGAVHRFEDFSEDFAVWVIFYGPDGGETGR